MTFIQSISGIISIDVIFANAKDNIQILDEVKLSQNKELCTLVHRCCVTPTDLECLAQHGQRYRKRSCRQVLQDSDFSK